MVGGPLWGLILASEGVHRRPRGGSTTMLNYLAAFLLSWAVNGPLRGEDVTYARTDDLVAAQLPIIMGTTGHAGILIAAAAVPIVGWLLFRSTIGFEIRTAGANSEAARYAGMNPRWLIIFTMSLCGLFAGLAAATEVLGDLHYVPASYATTVGFDAIAVALLGRANPVGILLSGLLFGAMQTGSGPMRSRHRVPQIVSVRRRSSCSS
jgi:simple sugar transport system permease protein